MRIIYPENINREFDAMINLALPYIFMNEEKHACDFVDGTPPDIKDKYYTWLKHVHEYEHNAGYDELR